ncbi:maleylpyruvate isomerase [Raineyella antarctica]|uniref:Maleylpyruvate isomerase n=1 Tax=Raineyella antarctica TaxID=1577474 RepID=A0A1G6GDX7_9ACTN|nr:maleylpyruvate isomerase [Raineyella antarctica]
MGGVTTKTPGPDALNGALAALQTSTHALLGATIQVSDEDWAGPSGLPGWTRAELAAHIARHADALRGVVDGALRGESVPLYPTPEAREEGIRAGAGRSGLAIQEDLDTACGELDASFDKVKDWSVPVDFRGTELPLALLPFGRLAEVVLHHVDLAIGYRLEDLDPEVAGYALDWAVTAIARKPEAPALRLVADEGRTWTVPVPGDPVEVTGSAAGLLGWLAGRLGPEAVSGADDVTVPSW